MKNIFIILMLIVAKVAYGQGSMFIYNYTNYNLYNTLVGSNQNANCIPSLSGTNYPTPVPTGSSVTYTGYYQSGLQNPPIMKWEMLLQNGSSVQNHVSPILNTVPIKNNTSWQMNKFFVQDSNGNSVPFGGNSIGVINCNTPVIDYIGPTPGNPIPYEAFWFAVGNDTYFIIQ